MSTLLRNYDRIDTALTDPQGPTQGADRVLRGGSWDSNPPWFCRSAFRSRGTPDSQSIEFGFRVVISARAP